MIWGTPVNSYYGDIEKKKKKKLKAVMIAALASSFDVN